MMLRRFFLRMLTEITIVFSAIGSLFRKHKAEAKDSVPRAERQIQKHAVPVMSFEGGKVVVRERSATAGIGDDQRGELISSPSVSTMQFMEALNRSDGFDGKFAEEIEPSMKALLAWKYRKKTFVYLAKGYTKCSHDFYCQRMAPATFAVHCHLCGLCYSVTEPNGCTHTAPDSSGRCLACYEEIGWNKKPCKHQFAVDKATPENDLCYACGFVKLNVRQRQSCPPHRPNGIGYCEKCGKSVNNVGERCNHIFVGPVCLNCGVVSTPATPLNWINENTARAIMAYQAKGGQVGVSVPFPFKKDDAALMDRFIKELRIRDSVKVEYDEYDNWKLIKMKPVQVSITTPKEAPSVPGPERRIYVPDEEEK